MIIKYNRAVKYTVYAVLTQPMHIGSAYGDKEYVLVHPVDRKPFIQASSIAGVFRSEYEKTHPGSVRDLFGGQDGDALTESRIKFTDGSFADNENLRLELRPRVSIDRESGTVNSSESRGSDGRSGHKFNMEYIGKGAEFQFTIYLLEGKKDYQQGVEAILAAADAGILQFGGLKSNGCGFFTIEKLYRSVYDMTVADDRKAWCSTYGPDDDADRRTDITDEVRNMDTAGSGAAYSFILRGRTEDVLLVKSIAVPNYNSDTSPDAVNIQDANGDYIVPGSSLKGVIRSRMEQIAGYLGTEYVIDKAFGRVSVSGEKNSSAGIVRFRDTVVGDKKKNDNMPPAYRIHIDKFTGGVINGGLFSEKNISGDFEIRIDIMHSRDHSQAENMTCGLMLFALRDLADKSISVGSGSSVGKGYLDIDTIELISGGDSVIMHPGSGETEGSEEIIRKCIGALDEARRA